MTRVEGTMQTAQETVKDNRAQPLEAAIDRRGQVVLTCNTQQGWRTFKAQFKAGSRGSRTIEFAARTTDDTPGWAIPATGNTLGVTFRVGHKKCLFAVAVKSMERKASVLTVTTAWPDQLDLLQRRAYERATPPGRTVIAVRFWRDAPTAEAATNERTVRHGQLEDVSAGGMRVKVAGADDIEPGTCYRCAFAPRPGKPSLVVDALVRHREAVEGGRASVGFQFVGLETTPEGRRTLDRLARTVQQYHRARSRNHSPA